MKSLKFGYMAGIALGALAMTSCAGDEIIDNPAANGNTVFVRTTVTVPTATTRTTLDETTEGNLSWKWKQNDRIYATLNGAGIGYLLVSEVNEADPTQATVEGYLSGLGEGENNVEFHYLGQQLDANGNEKNGMEFDGSYALDLSNKYVASTGNIESNDFAVNYDELTQYDILANETPITIEVKNNTGDIKSFYMIHKLAMGHVTIEGVDNIASVTVTNQDGKGVYTTADYNFKNRELQNMGYKDFNTDCSDFYFPILPQENADFNFEIVDNQGRVWKADFQYKSGDMAGQHAVLNIQAGHFYRTGYQIGLKPVLTADRVMTLNLYDHENSLITTLKEHATADMVANGHHFDLAQVDLTNVLPGHMEATGWAREHQGEKVYEVNGTHHQTAMVEELHLLATAKQVNFTLHYNLNGGSAVNNLLTDLLATEDLKADGTASHTFNLNNNSDNISKNTDGISYSFRGWEYNGNIVSSVTLTSNGTDVVDEVIARYYEYYDLTFYHDLDKMGIEYEGDHHKTFTVDGIDVDGFAVWNFGKDVKYIPTPKDATVNLQFLGWSTKEGATTPDEGMSLDDINNGKAVKVLHNASTKNNYTYHAVWKRNNTTITGPGTIPGTDPTK